MNHSSINWPNDLSEKVFKQKYWQQKPVLVRNLFSKDIVKTPPITHSEILRISQTDLVPTKCVYKGKAWHVKNGPLTPTFLKKIESNYWTILIDKINTQLTYADRFFHLFNFIDLFRLKDLMVSLSNKGGGVGPHFDSYDVFLVQAYGQKLWQLSHRFDRTFTNNPDLKILKYFKPEEEFVLNPGDALYLPPNVAHNGIAIQDTSITYSIGLRTPNILYLTDKVFFYHMENISFDSDSLLDYKKIKPSTNPMAFSDQLANQISSKISNLFPKPAEIKKNLVKSITESDDEILDRVGNNEISFSDFHFLLGKNNLNINPSMKAIFWKDNFFYNGEELDLSTLSEKQYRIIKSLLEELIIKRTISVKSVSRIKSSCILEILFFLYQQNLVTFKHLSI